MTGARLEFFLKSIGYPDRMPEGSVSSALRVDGMEVLAEERNGRIVLSYVLTTEASFLPVLSGYAAGRMLREEAVLAHDRSSAFLWQDAPANSGARELVRLFETFVDSCDWWRERVDALRGGASASGAPDDTMVIRP
jgi:hypothetical protein